MQEVIARAFLAWNLGDDEEEDDDGKESELSGVSSTKMRLAKILATGGVY